jgi:hypothetical protein
MDRHSRRDDLPAGFHRAEDRQGHGAACGETITVKSADLTLHLLELNLNSALAEFEFLLYVAAQKILNAVFDLVKTAVRT